MENGIDFVLTWVDGSDPDWQASRRLWSEKCGRTDTRESGAVTASRYRDWGTLRYWFRAVHTYAPWVHGIYFVTCGQTPDWLRTDAPKLHLVRHEDYIPAMYLPTFSSHPIELNFHRIPGLSETFVLFCDDFFLTAPVAPEDFFRGGLPCDCIEEQPVRFTESGVYNSIRANDIVFANRHFDKADCRRRHRNKWYSLHTPHAAAKNLLLSRLHEPEVFGFHIPHTPQPFLRRTFERCWAAEPELLDETCSHRFRDARDISQTAFRYWQLLSGDFAPYDRKKVSRSFQIGTDLDGVCRAVTEKRYKMICANDDGVTDYEKSRQQLLAAFEAALPEKSPFER